MSLIGELAIAGFFGLMGYIVWKIFRPILAYQDFEENQVIAKIELLNKVLMKKGLMEEEKEGRKSLNDKMYDDMHKEYDQAKAGEKKK